MNNYSILYDRGKWFNGCRYKYPLPFDFYIHLDSKYFLIEYDGIQHFESVKGWGGEKALKVVQRRDAIKTKFAQDNGFVLIRIPYTVKSIAAYLQFELEKYLTFPLDQLKDQPQKPHPKIKPINPYQWQQGVLL